MNEISRRQAIKTTALAAAAVATTPTLFAQTNSATAPAASGPFTLPPLPYATDALEPFIDAQTMTIHHNKHHKAYVDNLNKTWETMLWGGPPPTFSYLENIWLSNSGFISEPKNIAVRNHGGGHYNHSLFWQMMKPGGSQPSTELVTALAQSFGAFSVFKQQFTEAATKIFGSGWAWLVLDGKTLKIETTPNQDTPLSSGKQVLLGLDVWEHAYYLKYQNKRADYITAWWNVVNWDFVAERYAKLKT